MKIFLGLRLIISYNLTCLNHPYLHSIRFSKIHYSDSLWSKPNSPQYILRLSHKLIGFTISVNRDSDNNEL